MKIAIIGQGGHSKVIRDLISFHQHDQIIAYLDDKITDFYQRDNVYFGPIFYAEFLKNMYHDLKLFIAIGHNQTRKMIVERLQFPPENYITLIHKTAVVSPTSKIGNGSILMAHSTVNADSLIGQHSIINTSSVVEHDSRIGDFVHISPNATLTGSVQVENGVHIGAGATIIPNLTIGKWSVIGAGATVIDSIPASSIAVGVPAKVKNKQMTEGV